MGCRPGGNPARRGTVTARRRSVLAFVDVADLGDLSRARPHWRALGAEAGLDERNIRLVSRRRRYARGDSIFHEGDPAGAFHMLDHGHVAIRRTTRRGDVSIIDVLRPGDSFGEQVLIHGDGDRSASATAIDDVETLTIDKASFENLREGHPGVDRFLLMVLSNRLRETSTQLLEARYVTGAHRLYRCVLQLADHFDATGGGVIPLRQSDVASMAGVTRPTANRLLRQAARDGVIAIGRERLEVLDAPALRQRAGLN
jgi:CRP/FNR family cyclic AMP-dependent transcriptional regulator